MILVPAWALPAAGLSSSSKIVVVDFNERFFALLRRIGFEAYLLLRSVLSNLKMKQGLAART